MIAAILSFVKGFPEFMFPEFTDMSLNIEPGRKCANPQYSVENLFGRSSFAVL
jgi:hypothetical protein